MARQGLGQTGGALVTVAVLLGALALGGCGTARRDGGAQSGTGADAGWPSVTVVVAGALPATRTIPATVPVPLTGTVVNDPNPVPTRSLPPPGSTDPSPGSPAIRPTKPSTGPDDPAFNAEDARAYVESHGADGGRMVATGPTTVDRVLFVRGADAGYPDYPLLCLVLMRGDYHLVPPPGIKPTTAVTSDGITLIFDAHTGNDLGSGGSLWATPVPHQ